MKVISWNIRYSSKDSTNRRVEHLKSLEWDLVALQEVSKPAWSVLSRSAIFSSGEFTLDAFGIRSPDRHTHGVAVISRNPDLGISSPQLLPGIPKVERGLSVKIDGLARPFKMVSWHAPNAASEGEPTKMKGYSGFTTWLESVDHPCIACFDGNHWNPGTSLDSPDPPKPGDKFFAESLFFSRGATHHLRDALLEYLKTSPDSYHRILDELPNGPLGVSYIRKGSGKILIKDRFDYIFASPEFTVNSCTYEYEQAVAAGSDHGTVIAELGLS